MRRQPITSSNLCSVGYDEERQILEIEFNSGRVYQYIDVPKEEYLRLLNAPSKGTYFNNSIRNAYAYTRIK